jgi:O-antigen/teichoic acid export membrane protein
MKKIINSRYFIAILNRILVVIMSFGATVLINRALSPTLKGEYAYILNMVSVGTVICSFGMGQVYATYRKKYGDDIRNSFVLITLVQCALIGLLYLYFIYGDFSSELSIILGLTLVTVLRSNFSIIAVVDDFKKRNYLLLLFQILYIFLLVFAYFTRIVDVNSFLIIYVINEFLISVGIAITFKFKIDRTLFLKYKVKIMDIIKFGFYTMLMALLITFNYSLDIIMLKKMGISLSDVGIYSVSITLSNMLLLIPDAFKEILFGESTKSDSVSKIIQFLKICIFLSVILISGFVLLGYPFTLFLYGEDYIASFPVTLIMFCGSFSMILYKIIHPIYIADGKQKIVSIILFGSVIINLISNYFIIPIMGIYGAALSTVFSYTFTGVIFLLIFMKQYNVRFVDFVRRKK